MTFDIVTIFPAMVEAGLAEGVVGRARSRGVLDIRVHDLRAFTVDRHHVVDDVPFGGGPGMVMKAEPFYAAVQAIRAARGGGCRVVLTSPAGRRFDQAAAESMARDAGVIWLCGRYEGVDDRVVEAVGAEEWSIGDYVLSGGELPALVMVDAIARLVPGVVGDERSVANDSFTAGQLDHPHYTRPSVWRGRAVPDVLVSGHHGAIARWRHEAAASRTRARRPDLSGGSARVEEGKGEES
ncbi:MAG: tRNA (guanosine(37)-N1)-methyltransferase TrmD [Vicinamibacterales bacterium]